MTAKIEITRDIILRFFQERDKEITVPSDEEDLRNLILDLEEDKSLGFSFSEQKSEWREYFYDETDITAPCSRNYETKSVAKELLNGKWVGYTYWYGGGKHGNPEEIEWMEDSYFLGYEEKVITKKYFYQQPNE